MKVAFVAFGALGIQLLDFITILYQPSEILIFDDVAYNNKVINALPFSEYSNSQYAEYSFFIGLGYKNLPLRSRIIEELLSKGYSLPNIIHQSCFISLTATIGRAVYIYPMCNIDKGVCIKNGTIINNSVVISHDTSVGESCYLSPGVTLSGAVTIGRNTFLGTSCAVANSIAIGENVIVGIGSVVTSNIPNYKSCIGNPLKILDKKIELY